MTRLCEEKEGRIRLTVGKDAAYYHPGAAHVFWNSDVQPYGYAGVRALIAQMEQEMKRECA